MEGKSAKILVVLSAIFLLGIVLSALESSSEPVNPLIFLGIPWEGEPHIIALEMQKPEPGKSIYEYESFEEGKLYANGEVRHGISSPKSIPERIPIAQNACVDCHQGLDDDPWGSYEEWSISEHGKNQVTCDCCHGGDPTRTYGDIHEGVKPSSDPQSKIYFKNLPDTCGGCHKKIYDAFSQSKHYQYLMEGKLAPDCRTCMGSHEVKVDPGEISRKCEICMNSQVGVNPSPTWEARATLGRISLIKDEITDAQQLISEGKEKGTDLTKAEASLGMAESRLTNLGVKWHTFDLDYFAEDIEVASHYASTTRALAQSAATGPISILTLGGILLLLLFLVGLLKRIL